MVSKSRSVGRVWGSRLRVAAAVRAATLVSVLVVVVGSAPAAQASLSWSSPATVVPVSPGGLSCASSLFCAAGFAGAAVTFDGHSWSVPVGIDGGRQISSVSCPSSRFCVAVDPTGRALSFNGSTWSTPTVIDRFASLMSVSCPSAEFCVAVDYAGHAVTFNAGHWGSPVLIDGPASPGSPYLDSVSCPTSSFCVATDAVGNAIVYMNGSWGAPMRIDTVLGHVALSRSLSFNVRPGFPAPAPSGLLVSCPTSSFCAAVDGAGNAFTFDGVSWSSADDIDGAFPLASVSCVSASFCVAFDGIKAFAFNGVSWSSPTAVAAESALPPAASTVSCTTTTFCVALTSAGLEAVFNGTSWSTPIPVGGAGLSSIACLSASSCLAVDRNGSGTLFTGKSWSALAMLDSSALQRGGLARVSCVPPAFCAALEDGGEGRLFVIEDGSASAPVRLEVTATPIAVSCASSSFCIAVDSDGRAFTYNGLTWTGPTAIDPHVNLTDVSCPTTSFCAAVDYEGYAVFYNGHAWGTPSRFGPLDGQAAVSCTSNHFCAAVNGGEASVFNGRTWSKPVHVLTVTVAGGLSLSCASPLLCVAANGNGSATEFDGNAWSRAVTVDGGQNPPGPISVACPSTSLCVLVNGSGKATIGSQRPPKAPALRISISSSRARVHKRHAMVGLACSGGTVLNSCSGTVSLTRSTTRHLLRRVKGHIRLVKMVTTIVLAHGRYSLPAHTSSSVSMRLSGAALSLLRRTRNNRLLITATVTLIRGHSSHRALQLTL